MTIRTKVANLISPKREELTAYYGKEGGSAKSETGKARSRIKKDKLEELYLSDPLAFSSVNQITKEFKARSYKLRHSSDEVVNYFSDLCETIGLKYLIPEIAEHLAIYGEEFIEVLENDGEVTGLYQITPGTIKFKKDSTGDIALDDKNRPKGYKQESTTVRAGRDKPKFDRDEIIHFKLYTIGDGFRGIGLLEPAYNMAKWKLNMSHGWAEAVYKNGLPQRWIKVGNKDNPPTRQQIQELTKKVNKVNPNKDIGVPYYVNQDVYSPKIPKIQKNMKHYIDAQIAASGVPRPFIMGSGEQTNRAILARQSENFENTIEFIRDKISRKLEEEFFKRIAETHDKVDDYPRIEWPPINFEEIDAQVGRILKYVDKDLLTKEEAREKIIELERFNIEP